MGEIESPVITNARSADTDWQSVADIPNFPLSDFAALQQAITEDRFSLGLDSLSAAEWASQHNSWAKRLIVKALSLMLWAGALVSIGLALAQANYWLLFGLPIIAVTFLVSDPAYWGRPYVTLAGLAMILLAVWQLLDGSETLGLLSGLGGLTFGLVRAASLLTLSSFRRALTSDEKTFIKVYLQGGCTLRENATGRLFLNS